MSPRVLTTRASADSGISIDAEPKNLSPDRLIQKLTDCCRQVASAMVSYSSCELLFVGKSLLASVVDTVLGVCVVVWCGAPRFGCQKRVGAAKRSPGGY